MSDQKNIPVGVKIAAAAIARQQGLNRKQYAVLCQKLARETVQSQTNALDNVLGKTQHPVSAKAAQKAFQKAGMGEKYQSSSQLAPGDIVYSNEGSPQYGHAMIVGPDRQLYDQVGHGAPQKAGFRHPSWVVHPDSAIAAYNKARNSGLPHAQAQSAAVTTPRATARSTPQPSILPTPIPSAQRAQLASNAPYKMRIRQSDVEGAAQAMASQQNTATTTPYTVPPEDISFAAPPPMPNNIPSAPPTSTPPAIPQGDASASFSFSPPTPSAPPSPQWQRSDAGQQFQPTDYTQMSPSLSYGQGYDDHGMSLSLEPSDYGYSYFSSPTGTWETSPNYLDVSPTEQSQGDAVASQGGGDIASFGGDMSLGGDLQSATDAYLGIPGSLGGDAATQDFYAANNQYGEGGWYYNSQGDIVPVSSPDFVQPPDLSSVGSTSSAPRPQGFGDLVTPPPMPPVEGFTGGFDVGAGPQFGITPEGFSTGYIPFGGSGSGGSMVGTAGGRGGVGPQFSGGGSFDSSLFQPRQGFFGLGGMNAAGGGYMPVGFTGPESSMDYPTAVGEGEGGTKKGMGLEAYLDSLPQPTMVADQPQYITGWDWTKNPGSAMQHGGSRGWWSPQYTQGTGIDAAMPTAKTPQHLEYGGKVPGVDRGVDEVSALLEPGEIVVNRSQMRGLKVGNSKFLRSDQKRAIKQAKKAA